MSPYSCALLITVSVCFTSGAGDDDSTIQLIFTMFRHGHRANDQFTSYPTDPNKNATYYPYGFGQLTNEGKMREYNLGKLLHKRYSKFLGMYVPSQIDAWSSDVNRTKMSLELVLAGLYPPESPLDWNKELNWQPIPYNVLPRLSPYVAMPQFFCKRHAKLYHIYKESGEGLALEEKYKYKFPYIEEHTGLHMQTLIDMYLLHFTFLIEKENGLAIPEWSSEFYPDISENAAIDYYISSTGTQELKTLSQGSTVKMLVDLITRKIENTIIPPDKKMLMFSAHELNIAGLLRCFNVFYRHIPTYGSCIMLELHLIDGVYGIKIFYQDWTTPDPKLLTIPGCDSFCPFERFKEIVSVYFPEDDNLCNKIDDL